MMESSPQLLNSHAVGELPAVSESIARLIVKRDGQLLRDVPIFKTRLTLGRRSYNDIELNDLTVSGEHAVLHVKKGEIVIHDLNSRNGTLVNGQTVMQQVLVDGDELEVGVFRLRLQMQSEFSSNRAARVLTASLEVLQGAPIGEPIAMSRPINTIGNPGQNVAVVARRRQGFFITHLEGLSYPMVNGESIGLAAFALDHDDVIELGGATYKFHLQVS